MAYSLIIQLRQQPGAFHTHRIMGTLTLNKMNRGKEKNRGLHLSRKNHQETQQWHWVSPVTSLSLCISSFSREGKTSPKTNLGCADVVVLSCWYFHLPPVDLGFPTHFLKAFPFRLSSTLRSFWRDCSTQTCKNFQFWLLGKAHCSTASS